MVLNCLAIAFDGLGVAVSRLPYFLIGHDHVG